MQRVGSSNGPKPPTPVRRSSSITSSSVPLKHSDHLASNKSEHAQSLSSGAGEVRYSPNLRELKSHSALSSPQEKFNLSLRHVEMNSPSENASNGSSPNKDSSSSSENNSIVTDVSDSRARLIHDLNSALQLQRPPPVAKKPQNEPPAVPPRNASKERNAQNNPKMDDKGSADNILYGPVKNTSREPHLLSKTKSEERCSAENVLYGQCLKSERSSHTFSAKPLTPHDIQRQFHQKPRLKECLSQSDLLQCKDWERSYEHKNGNGNELPDNERLFKRSFVVALNAKLAEHRQNQEEVGSDKQTWQMKNDKNYHSWNSGFHHLQPQICRESLMDQIKRGTRLRRVTCNDRSKPRLA